MNYKITLSYNGSNYHGWGKQPGYLTVEQTIIDVFKKLFKLDVCLYVSGRTDAGVHALNQVFNVDHPALNILDSKLCQALNSQMPSDIFIKNVEVVKPDFHARFNCQSKTYLYLINANPIYDVINHQQMLQYNQPLCLAKLQTASKCFIGEHDFLSFSTTDLEQTVRTIYQIEITEHQGIMQIKISGNGFLRSMVRMIVGSLLDYNEDKLLLDDIKRYLLYPKKGQAVHKAPARGLYLMSVYYN